MEFNQKKVEDKMLKSVDVLKKELSGLRTGRASVGLLEPIQVDAYGSKVPLSQVSAISVPESRMLAVQVWDNSLISVVENAIRTANLGLNPMTEGNLIRLPIPDLTEERRKEIAKLASKYSEDTKISVRNVRRDAMDYLKESEKNKEISKDELFQYSDQIQKLTDKIILLIDELFYEKEKDILQI